MSFFCALRIEISKFRNWASNAPPLAGCRLPPSSHTRTAENQSKTLRDSMLHVFRVFHRTSGGLIFLKKGVAEGMFCGVSRPACKAAIVKNEQRNL